MAEIDVRDCPKCDNGTKGSYDARVTVGGRGIFTCQVCGMRWQDADEEPSSKGVPVNPSPAAVEEDAPKDQRFPPLEACDCGSAQEDHGWACRCDNPPSKRTAVEEDAHGD